MNGCRESAVDLNALLVRREVGYHIIAWKIKKKPLVRVMPFRRNRDSKKWEGGWNSPPETQPWKSCQLFGPFLEGAPGGDAGCGSGRPWHGNEWI